MEEKRVDENVVEEKTVEVEPTEKYTQPKKKNLSTLIYSLVVVLIFAAFGGVVYYNKVVHVKKQQDKKFAKNEYGAKNEEDFTKNYLEVAKYKGLKCEITQEMLDEYIEGDTVSYENVERAAKDTDQVEFNLTGYVDGKKEADITLKEQEITVGEETDGPFQPISDLVKGKSEGDVIENVEGIDSAEISEEGKDYSGKKVTFNVKVVSVSEKKVEKITDDWVKEEFSEDYGWTTTKDYYDYVKEELKNEAISDLWKQVVDGSVLKKYPEDAYARIIEEVDADYNYAASEWGMELNDYLEVMQMTEKDMEKEYESELISEMASWYIAFKEDLLNISESEMNEWWEKSYEDYGYESVEEMKENYEESEIKRAIILEKAANFVYDHATVKQSYKIPE